MVGVVIYIFSISCYFSFINWWKAGLQKDCNTITRF